ncbi:serine hydrolase domain-containing protein [Sinosporangium siamense]|uniref:Serine hydrolase n=1 Tax=Sinosporangium siamense TaxID=1367973 RepID=A0A919RNA9_9ACTN|nr:serine hydrolase domain-containing protein [Sinosporangium siamense]GII96005.1 serine hydrolase [Sinosporangium siamense]
MNLEDLQKSLDASARARGVPGAAVAVWTGDELLEAATGVLNVDTGVEATPDSVYQVGSTSKVWTAALVMQLVDEGLVDLDAPVRTYLPEFVLADEEAAKAITVRHLLTHTPGFDGDIFTDTGRGDDCVTIYLGTMKDAPQVTPPGTALAYCNSGYVVLGALVAKLRGAVYEQVLRERLLDPLGCTQAALYPEEAVLFRAAAGHVTPPGGSEQVVSKMWMFPRSLGPAGSIMSLAPRELVRFGRMILAGGVAEDGTRILSEESVRAMITPQFPIPDYPMFSGHWGLGFIIMGLGAGAFGHSGGTPGQSTIWWVAPETGVVAALNANGGNLMGMIEDVLDPIAREAGLEPEPAAVPPADPQPVDTTPYIGRYECSMGRYDFEDDNGFLKVTTTPLGIGADMGGASEVRRFVWRGDHSFICDTAREGMYEVAKFLMDGDRATHLFNTRSLPRV